jgi:predicted enzyme related to lactoylglutathione lyase
MITVDKITIAVGRMDEMVEFYEKVFGISFRAFEAFGGQLNTAKMGSMELLLCPKKIAQVEADINTIQLRFVVADVVQSLKDGLKSGGKQLSDVQEQDGMLLAALRDPDRNSLELIQASQ